MTTLTIEQEFWAILEKESKTINEDKVDVSFNPNSIEVMEILEDGTNGYGNKFYSAYKAIDFLKGLEALE